jgi:hypothetical protein
MDREQKLDEVITAYLKAVEAGHGPDPAEWLAHYPELADDLREFLAEQRHLDRVAAPLRELAPAAPCDNADLPTITPGDPAGAAPALGTVRYSATTRWWARSPAAAWASFTGRAR